MKSFAVTIAFALPLSVPFALAAATQESAPTDPRYGAHEAEQPPRRIRVTVDGEMFDLDLGGATVATKLGCTIRADPLPTRRFARAGSFSFDYLDGWRFLASAGNPNPIGAWWTIGGDGSNVSLRRHDGDALAIRDLYASNCEATGSRPRRRCTLELDGRTLEGWAVDMTIGSLDGSPRTDAVQQVFGWQESESVAWMLAIQRNFPSRTASIIPDFDLTDIVFEVEEPQDARAKEGAASEDSEGDGTGSVGTQEDETSAAETAAEQVRRLVASRDFGGRDDLRTHPELRIVLDSFRWLR